MSPLSDTPPPEGQEMPQEPERVADRSQLSNQDLENWMRWAAYQCATTAAAAQVPREQQEAADAALKFAQAIVILDPTVVAPQGVPPDALSSARPRIPMDTSAPSAKHSAGG